MKNILNWVSFLEAYINSDFTTINQIIDLRDYDFIYKESSESVKQVNKILRDNKNKLIKLFHGTHPDISILENGLLTTKLKTKKSIQSQVGFVYLSIYPDMAKTFGNLAYGITNATVYQIELPIKHLLPDKDQLFNKIRSSSEYNINLKIGNTLGDSAIYGHGFRVKGDIPPYMIKKIETD